MPAYIIGIVDVIDHEVYSEYRRGVGPLFEKFGGKVLTVRGKKEFAHEILEGDWNPGFVHVFQFPDMAAARAFYNSPEYAPLIEFRKKAANVRMVLVEGN
jgi:uncharacterized protein (DUF1330 family)